MRGIVLSFLMILASTTATTATTPEAGTIAGAQTASAGPVAGETFTYNPEGRRDPFVSLTARGTDQASARSSQERDDAGGLAVEEISVRGIVATGSGYVAMVRGPNGKTFVIHQNEKLLDGTVKSITAQAIVILQDVSDPLSMVKQKEVRKLLRGLEEGK
jgi:Tfp pilus assembly protein PilP